MYWTILSLEEFPRVMLWKLNSPESACEFVSHFAQYHTMPEEV